MFLLCPVVVVVWKKPPEGTKPWDRLLEDLGYTVDSKKSETLKTRQKDFCPKARVKARNVSAKLSNANFEQY